MFHRLSIAPRLILLLSILTLTLVAVGVTTVIGLRAAANTTAQLYKNANEQGALNELNEALRTDLFTTINDASSGRLAWDQAQMDVAAVQNLFIGLWEEYLADKTPQEITALRDSLARHYEFLMSTFSDLENIFVAQDKVRLANYQEAQLKRLITPFIEELNERIAQQQLQADTLARLGASSNWAYVFGVVTAVLLGMVVTGALGASLYQSRAHDTDASAPLRVPDEQATQSTHDAMSALLHAVSALNGRDLTLKIRVTDDVAAPVADALNQVTDETAQVLIDVRRIAEYLAKAAVMVRTQSDVVMAAAANEQNEIDETARVLNRAAELFARSAQLAQVCDSAVEDANQANHAAQQAIADTANGINAIGHTLHESQRPIQRLGEQTHDLARVINLINHTAERAHICALNAGLSAAVVGGAGQGFAVVANAVLRLAEQAREATQTASVLVVNIQADANDAMLTINNTVAHVAAGIHIAERASQHLANTGNRTAVLIESVRNMVADHAGSITLSGELEERAQGMHAYARKTHEQMQEQTQHTKRLVQYSKGLLSAVQVFTLPGDDEEPASVHLKRRAL